MIIPSIGHKHLLFAKVINTTVIYSQITNWAYMVIHLVFFLRNLHHKKCSIEKTRPDFTFKTMMNMLRGVQDASQDG